MIVRITPRLPMSKYLKQLNYEVVQEKRLRSTRKWQPCHTPAYAILQQIALEKLATTDGHILENPPRTQLDLAGGSIVLCASARELIVNVVQS